jgi:IclR family mhp operon transcriptional activator
MCPDEEREDMLELLRSGSGGEEQQALARNDTLMRSLIRRVRDDGFGTNLGDWTAQAKIGAVAVAIRDDERVYASLNVVFLSRAVSLADAIRRYVPPLQESAEKIVAALREK